MTNILKLNLDKPRRTVRHHANRKSASIPERDSPVFGKPVATAAALRPAFPGHGGVAADLAEFAGLEMAAPGGGGELSLHCPSLRR